MSTATGPTVCASPVPRYRGIMAAKLGFCGYPVPKRDPEVAKQPEKQVRKTDARGNCANPASKLQRTENNE